MRQSESGQIVVEYVLLLVIAVSVAVLMTRMMISRDPGSPGFVMEAWSKIVIGISRDLPDDPAP